MTTNLEADPEQAMLNSTLLLNIINQLPYAVFWKDLKGIFLGCNIKFARDGGFKSSAEVIGKTDEIMPWSNYARKYQEDDERVIQGTSLLDYEERHITANGKSAIVLVSKVPLYDAAGNVAGILGIFTDITVRKEIEGHLVEAKEAAEKANQAKLDFVQNMRHDILTPVVGMIGCAHLLKSKADTPILHDYAGKLITAGEAFLELVSNIMEKVQLATGKIILKKVPFLLLEQLQAIVTIHQTNAVAKSLAFSLDYDPNLPDTIISDPDCIQRITLELITNAFKYTEQGFVRISVALLEKLSHPILKLQVADSGIGIPEDKHEEIFNKFVRLVPAVAGVYQGMGLGLANIKQLLENLCGKITVESQLGQGSVFTCFIPVALKTAEPASVAKSKNANFEALLLDNSKSAVSKKLLVQERITPFVQQLQPEDKPTETSFPLLAVAEVGESYSISSSVVDNTVAVKTITPERSSQCRILLVEDEPISAQIASQFLSNLACTVDWVEKGETALICFERTIYDLIFTDISLPDISGYSLVKKIRNTERFQLKPIPIIALTAHGDESSKRKCLSIGISAVLVKPLLKTTAKEVLKAFIPQWKPIDLPKQSFENTLISNHTDKVIDFNQILALYNGDINFIKNALPLVVESLVSDLAQLEKACQGCNWSEISVIIHRLQGITCYFGLYDLEQACKQVAVLLQTSPESVQGEGYFLLNTEIERIKHSYREWLNTQHA
jgi:two-component system, OmpR family, aerobic respiration control sensor histidine kinase ArcB